ncbi:DNA-directed RNA polymerase I subunit RPA43 isoform X2 [Amblyraja radiata]|uniref:DNA-directed RNA polymerase I subunit RPA43 isoform X2 n=1 Tax=Amblyraja radiata TaxID=386614 RepID=UPI001403293A|nr:DNA-directed RNA polymerase I subunit RPA43 isoform X2 [Amblyraja radiata]
MATPGPAPAPAPSSGPAAALSSTPGPAPSSGPGALSSTPGPAHSSTPAPAPSSGPAAAALSSTQAPAPSSGPAAALSSTPGPAHSSTPGPAHSSTPGPALSSTPGPAHSSTQAPLSFTQARALIQSPFSCLVLDTCRRHLALCPLYLNRKRSGIERQLKTELLRFSETLQGVPVAYDKVRLIGELGDIYDDQGYIHLNIEADFVIFRPKIGQKLLGTVNKVAPSHLGCLVHGCFNASIPKPHHANGIWPDFAVKVGDSLEFEVQQLDADAAGVLCIRGRLDKSVQGPYGADFEELLEKDSIEQDGDAAGKKKRKKKKQKDEKCKEVEAVSCTSSDKSFSKHEMGDLEKNLERKSKKRKQRTEEPNTDNEFHESNTADYPNNSKPSKRKKKMIRDESGTTDCAQEPKHKRRKKD